MGGEERSWTSQRVAKFGQPGWSCEARGWWWNGSRRPAPRRARFALHASAAPQSNCIRRLLRRPGRAGPLPNGKKTTRRPFSTVASRRPVFNAAVGALARWRAPAVDCRLRRLVGFQAICRLFPPPLCSGGWREGRPLRGCCEEPGAQTALAASGPDNAGWRRAAPTRRGKEARPRFAWNRGPEKQGVES